MKCELHEGRHFFVFFTTIPSKTNYNTCTWLATKWHLYITVFWLICRWSLYLVSIIEQLLHWWWNKTDINSWELHQFPRTDITNSYKAGGLKEQELILSHLSRLERCDQGDSRAMLPMKALGRNPSCLSSLWWLLAALHYWVCGSMTPISICLHLAFFFFLSVYVLPCPHPHSQ